MKKASSEMIDRADVMLALSKSLDYPEIAKHNPEEIKKLKLAIASMGIETKSAYLQVNDVTAQELVSNKEGKGTANEIAEGDETAELYMNEKVAKLRAITDQLKNEGMDDRVGQVYSSFADNRRIEFKQAPHHRGIPPFDIVVAPDFAPGQGLHGIFITKHEVLSLVLPTEGDKETWTILKRKDYISLEEMSEYLMLLSAGFDLPE